MRRDGYSVFQCASCDLVFCAGCDRPDLPVRGLGWLEAAVVETGPVSCPACTEQVEDANRIGFIAGVEEASTDEPGTAPEATRP
jgi:hypothetical protein